MQLLLILAQGISAALFLWYGLGCLLSKRMVAEFEHYRLPHLRVTTGVLQIAGGLGLIGGHYYRPMLVTAAGGLALMMLFAFITRIRIRDPLYLALPSLTLCVLNLCLAAAALRMQERLGPG